MGSDRPVKLDRRDKGILIFLAILYVFARTVPALLATNWSGR